MEKSLYEMMHEIKNELNLTQAQFGEAIGANLDRIKSLMSGKVTNLSRSETRLMVENLHVNPTWLAIGKGEMLCPMHAVNKDQAIYSTQQEFVMVPRYDVRASAGNGTLIHSELIVDHLAFREEWVTQMGLSSHKLALITVQGDSMEPTLRANDLVLIDLRNGDIFDGIYAIQHKGHLLVKRIQSKLDGTVIVKSDNPMYESEILKSGYAENFIVVGRVVWFGRAI